MSEKEDCRADYERDRARDDQAMSEWDEAFAEVEVIRGLDFDKYLAIDAASNSRLKWLDKSPLHYAANPVEADTRSKGLGSMTHTAILEPSEFASRYVRVPDGMRRDKRTKVYREFLDLVPRSAEVVAGSDWDMALTIAETVKQDPMLQRFFGQDCESELTVIWTDTDTGERCKIRIDKFCPGVGFLDLKTSQDCSLSQFPWSARRYGYFKQMAFYRRGIMAAQAAGKLPSTGDDVPAYVLAVETGMVRAHALYWVPDAEITHFDQVVSENLDLLSRCRRDSIWPGPNGIDGAPLPLEYPGRLDYENDNETDAADGVAADWGE